MFGNNGPFSYNSGTNGGSLQSNSLFQHDRLSQKSSSSRPSGKAIYMQRKEYVESMSKQLDSFQYRVEHLFTDQLDGQDLSRVDDFVAKLKLLDARGRVWGQEMILEVQGGNLQLTDIETKEEYEALPLANIMKVQVVLDSCSYSSLLVLIVQDRGRAARVFMFQCEEVGAEQIRDDLERVVQRSKEEATNQYNIRSNLENVIGKDSRGGFRYPGPPQTLPEHYIPPPDHPLPQWNNPAHEDHRFAPDPVTPRDGPFPAYNGRRMEHPPPMYTETERTVEIFNHVINDLELFMAKVSAVASTKDNGKKKKNKNKKDVKAMPPWGEFVFCLQKLKYGFNLMGKVNGQINNPSAADFVHILFSTLGFLVSHCPQELPPSVLTPLLTDEAFRLMTQEVTPQEDHLWRSLGDAWNIPKARWPDGDMVPPYIPEFYDGWQPPPPVQVLPNDRPISRSNSQGYPPERPSQSSGPREPPASRSSAPSMRVMYDFMARNSQELSVMKGDVVQVLDQSRQWWKVRNTQNEEGYVPHNLLEVLEGGLPLELTQDPTSPPALNRMSQPEDVRAWLEYKGFSKITMRSLGVLTGSMLLGMTRDELRSVCPEEGGRVFFHLQGVKSTLALASEHDLGPYGRH